MLKVSTRFPRTWWICSNIALEVGFPEVLGLAVIPYYLSIVDLLNSWPTNSDPWSCMIFIGLGYLDNHIVSTKVAIDIDILSSYCVILNHHVTGSIIVTAFVSKSSFCPFLLVKWGPIISTRSLFHDIYSASLAGNLPYFYLVVLYVGVRVLVSYEEQEF